MNMKHTHLGRILLIALGLLAISSPAFAFQVTNMDKVPHTVVFIAAGSRTERTVQPDELIRFEGVADGKLSLKSENPRGNNGNLHSDGMLSGIIGVARDQDIPTDDGDSFVIWPDGELLLQSNNRRYNRNN